MRFGILRPGIILNESASTKKKKKDTKPSDGTVYV